MERVDDRVGVNGHFWNLGCRTAEDAAGEPTDDGSATETQGGVFDESGRAEVAADGLAGGPGGEPAAPPIPSDTAELTPGARASGASPPTVSAAAPTAPKPATPAATPPPTPIVGMVPVENEG